MTPEVRARPAGLQDVIRKIQAPSQRSCVLVVILLWHSRPVTFLSEMDEATGLIDGTKIRDKGLGLRKTYLTGQPFPHIAIDNFLPEAVLDRCLSNSHRRRGRSRRL